MHVAVDAVCLPVPQQQQDTIQTCVTCVHTQRIAETQPEPDSSPGRRAVLAVDQDDQCGVSLDSRQILCSLIGPLSFRKGLTA